MLENEVETTTLGQRLKVVRGARTKQSFATSLAVSVGALNNYEDDKRQPPADLLGRLAGEYGCDLHWLITGQERVPTGYKDFDERIFQRVSAAVFGELRSMGIYDEITPTELASALILINKTVMSTLGPQPRLSDVNLNDLGGVVRFIVKSSS